MSSTKKRKNKPKPGQRVHLSLLVPVEFKEQLAAEAKRRGHSMVFEAAHRLEWSFEKQALLRDVLRLWLGDEELVAGLVKIGNDMLDIRAAKRVEYRQQHQDYRTPAQMHAAGKEALAQDYEEVAKRIRG